MANELNQERREDAKLKKLALERQRTFDNFIQVAMGTPQGRIFFYEFLAMCKIGMNPFAANALIMSFNCGERNIGDQIQAKLIELAPNLYLKMLTEQQELQNGRQPSTQPAGDDTSGDGAGEQPREPTGPFDS